MTVEERIAELFANATEVARVAELNLGRRIVYLNRIPSLLSALRTTIGAMTQLENEAEPSDFNDDWCALRAKLALLQTQCQRIVRGADAPQPCQPNL